MNLTSNLLIVLSLVALVYGTLPVAVDNSAINAQISSYLASLEPNKMSGLNRYGPFGPMWPQPPEETYQTTLYTPLQQVALATCQTANLFVPLFQSIVNRFQTCWNMVGPEAYIGKFWVQFLSFDSGPIFDLIKCTEKLRDDVCYRASELGVNLDVGSG